MSLDFDFLQQPAELVAPRLLGCELVRELDGQAIRCRIVEAEAYDQADAASHSYKGKTPRTEIMFGPADRLYVYFTYGMHYCCNVVTGPEGYGSAVLIRAVEPIEGQEIMKSYRNDIEGVSVSNGPAKLCQALMIDRALNGHDLRQPPLRLVVRPALAKAEVMQATRIGISQAKDVPWRFYTKDSPYVSKK